MSVWMSEPGPELQMVFTDPHLYTRENAPRQAASIGEQMSVGDNINILRSS